MKIVMLSLTDPWAHAHGGTLRTRGFLRAGYAARAATLPLVVVGGVRYPGDYVRALQETAASDERVRVVGSVYDHELLDQLYAQSASYLHGHSVGGTNPSLLRAMAAAAPVLAFDVNFNREVLGDTGRFCVAGQQRAEALYVWDDVADRYEALCESLVKRR